MATKQDIANVGREAARYNNETTCLQERLNPYKHPSWQNQAWSHGYAEEVIAIHKENALVDKIVQLAAGVSASAVQMARFPERMPLPTRVHIASLHTAAMHTKDSTKAIRLDRKIDKLYQRWA